MAKDHLVFINKFILYEIIDIVILEESILKYPELFRGCKIKRLEIIKPEKKI